MSTEAQTYVDTALATAPIPRRARAVLYAVASYMHESPGTAHHRVCYAGQNRLAQRAGCCVRSLRTHIKTLMALGVITRTGRVRDTGGRGRATDEIRMCGFSDLPANSADRSLRPTGKNSTTYRQIVHDLPATVAGPYIDDTNYKPTTPTDGVGGGDGVDALIAAQRAVAHGDAARLHAIDAMLVPVLRQLRLDTPSPTGALTDLASWVTAAALTDDEARWAVSQVLIARHATVRPADIRAAVDAVRRRRAAAQPPGMGRVLHGDAVLMARWPAMLADLETRIGPQAVATWLGTCVLDGIRGGTAHVATHHGFVARGLDSYATQLRAALDAVYGGVTRLDVCCRRPWSAGQRSHQPETQTAASSQT